MGSARLVERFRVRFGADDRPWTKATLPVVGFGVSLMVRRRLLGLRDRVEGMEPAPQVPTDGLVIPSQRDRPSDGAAESSPDRNGTHADDPADDGVRRDRRLTECARCPAGSIASIPDRSAP